MLRRYLNQKRAEAGGGGSGGTVGSAATALLGKGVRSKYLTNIRGLTPALFADLICQVRHLGPKLGSNTVMGIYDTAKAYRKALDAPLDRS